MIKLKNVYDMPSEADGKRILITRLWPLDVDTYVSKIDLWLKDLAPSYSLLEWFREHPKDWDGFRERYLKELEIPGIKKILEELFDQSQKEDTTLLYGKEIPEKSPAGIIYELIGRYQKAEVRSQRSSPQRSSPQRSSPSCFYSPFGVGLGLGQNSENEKKKLGDESPKISSLSFVFCLLFSVICLLSLSGCSTSADYNPSMDYNPGWEDDRHTVKSFDQLPRHKNRLEHGIH